MTNISDDIKNLRERIEAAKANFQKTRKVLLFTSLLMGLSVTMAVYRVFFDGRLTQEEANKKAGISFNQGYRYGRMELLSYAIECEKVSNPILIAEYNRVLEIMKQHNELEPDNKPNDCSLEHPAIK